MTVSVRLCSIALLVEHRGASVLLGADAYGTVLAPALQQLARSRGTETLAVDALKLPHHASRANVVKELVAAAPARHYLVSTNGDVFHHPDDAALARLFSGTFDTTGQVCMAAKRIYVHRSRYDEVVDAAVEATRAMTVGDPRDPATVLGPVISSRHRERIEGMIDDDGHQLHFLPTRSRHFLDLDRDRRNRRTDRRHHREP